MGVERRTVADQVVDAVAVGDQQLRARQPADVLLALEQQLAGAPAGADLPGAGAGEAGDGDDPVDFGNEFAAGVSALP